MNLEIVTRNVNLTPQEEALAHKKLGRLQKYLSDVFEARLTVTQEKHRVMVDGFIRTRGGELTAHAESPDWSTSLQEVVHRLEEQARRLKTRRQERKRQGGKEKAWQVAFVRAESVRQGRPEIVEVKHVPVFPMSIEEAALQLDASRDDFIVFREADTDQISVLYRRRDNTYGLVTPEM